MKYLLIFTIGPVQSLINCSRKTNDMYAGSKLLSGLMREAVSFLNKKPGINILFPVEVKRTETNCPDNTLAGKQIPTPDSDMPNRLIAEIDTADSAYPADIGQRLESHVRQLFMDKCRNLLQDAGIEQKGLILAQRQLKDYPEVYWLVDSYGNRPYKEVYRSLFCKLQEIKGIRPFEQTAEPWSRKCILFPEYNAIFIKKREGNKYPANINKKCIYDITDNSTLRYLVKPGEALSAIALVKRVYPNPEDICSLRQMLLRSRVDKLPVQGAGRGDMLANAVYDIENQNPPDYDEYNEDMRKAAEILCGKIHQKGISLSSYYAMVKLDGDSMGDEFLKRDTPEKQRELSLCISKFASLIPDILKEYMGIPVYAGGEDFLGFLPLDNLFPCLEKLHYAFREKVKLTFSAGVVIAHLMQPLKEVAAAAEEMEHLAKQAKGKNACVTGIVKRSGDLVITPPLCFDDEAERVSLKNWSQLVVDLNQSGCSKSLLYHIGDLFRNFSEEKNAPAFNLAQILVHEAVAAAGAPETERLTERMMTFYKNENGLEGFLNILNASTFFAREVSACTI